jgi:hypothetical protein
VNFSAKGLAGDDLAQKGDKLGTGVPGGGPERACRSQDSFIAHLRVDNARILSALFYRVFTELIIARHTLERVTRSPDSRGLAPSLTI